jgi:hypothetical protein
MASGRARAKQRPRAAADASENAGDLTLRARLAIETSRELVARAKALLEGIRRLLNHAKHER